MIDRVGILWFVCALWLPVGAAANGLWAAELRPVARTVVAADEAFLGGRLEEPASLRTDGCDVGLGAGGGSKVSSFAAAEAQRAFVLVVSASCGGVFEGQWTYDGARRLTLNTFKHLSGIPRVSVFSESIGWSPRNLKNLSQRHDLGERGWDLTHDGARRLTEAQWRLFGDAEDEGSLTRFGYAYDTAQNLTAEVMSREKWVTDPQGNFAVAILSTTETFPPDARNRPTMAGETPLAYDERGNRTKEGSKTLHWDFRDRLVLVDFPDGGDVGYQYDVLNRRVRTVHWDDQNVSSTSVETVYDGWKEVEEYHDGLLYARHLRAGLDEIVRMEYDIDGNGTLDWTYHPLYDSTGNVSTLLNPGFFPVARYHYAPYGSHLQDPEQSGILTEVDDIAPRILQVILDGLLDRIRIEPSEEIFPDGLEGPNIRLEISDTGGAWSPLPIQVAQPVLTGHRARHAFTVTPDTPPDPGTTVRLTIEPEAVVDLFVNGMAEPLTLTFPWPAAPGAGESNWTVLLDEGGPEIELINVVESHIQVSLSEMPDVEDFSSAFIIDGSTVSWELQNDGYTLVTTLPLTNGSYVLGLAAGVPVDLDGKGLVQNFELVIANIDNQVAFEKPNPRFGPLEVTPNRFTYHGRPLDLEAGLYYHRNRWYDPQTGRFLSPDPYGFSDGPSEYQFALNSPYNFGDPTGEFVISVPILVATMAAAAIHGATAEINRATDIDPYANLWAAGSLGGARGAAIAGVATATAGFGGGLAAGLGGGLVAQGATAGAFAGAGVVFGEDLIDVGILHRRENFSSFERYAGTAAFGSALGGAVGAALAKFPRLGATPRLLFRDAKAWRLRRGRGMVTRWRSTDFESDVQMLRKGVLQSPAERLGADSRLSRDPFLRFQQMVSHSQNSSQPPSPLVSLTRDPGVARIFGKSVFRFRVRKMHIRRAWWSGHNEAEDLVLGGTRVFKVKELP